MRGKKVLMESLIAHHVGFIFGNPGTTESPIIDSLIDYPQLRYIAALHEGVALGAASYYAQATGKTAVVNLHVAPGLGNALGMLYDALKANSPLLVTAGQQDTRLRLRDPLLGHDLVAMAAPLTKWSVQAERAYELPLLLHRAFKVTQDPPAGPVLSPYRSTYWSRKQRWNLCLSGRYTAADCQILPVSRKPRPCF